MATAVRPQTRREVLQVLTLLARRKGDLFVYTTGHPPSYLANRPEYVRHVLVDRAAQYSKDTPMNAGFDTTIARGLLTSEGEEWSRQRALMQPYFARRRMPAVADIVIEQFELISQEWETAVATGTDIDLSLAMSWLTFRITAMALFHVDTSAWDKRTAALMNAALPVLCDLNAEAFREAQVDIWTTAAKIVGERMHREPLDDLLGGLIASGREESTSSALREHVATMSLAGYETTATVCTWACYLLATNESVADRLRRDIAEQTGDRPLRYEDVPAIPYLTAVVKETMRLYPPAWIIGRRALESDRIGDTDIPVNSVVAISPYTLHRHPRYWPDPEVFDPRRFISEEVERKHEAFSFIPFGAGPRTCIGSNFALVEAPLIIGRMVQRYRLALANQDPVQPKGVFVLVPHEAIRMRLDAAA
ncbi:MAG: cytochrome P450 [Candidatus Dormibacteraeota bacterium]|nr:cytochrome P450 [Candidatus Dormibacteraeota bacterium]